MFSFIEKRLFFYLLSLFFIFFGALSFYFFNPRFGIDLAGGQVLEIKTNLKVEDIKKLNKNIFIFETKETKIIKSQEDLNKLYQEIKKLDSKAERLKFESISSSLSSELRKRATLTIVFVLLAIGIYVGFTFSKLKNYFSIFKLSLIVILTLFHDLLGMTGFYLLLSKILNFEIDIKFITALLIIAGFSVHDTIIVFDRLRENIFKTKKKTKEIFDESIKQTLRRSVFTSLTAFLAILPFIFLIPDLRAFLLLIEIGIIIGTYSSICLATPLLFDLS